MRVHRHRSRCAYTATAAGRTAPAGRLSSTHPSWRARCATQSTSVLWRARLRGDGDAHTAQAEEDHRAGWPPLCGSRLQECAQSRRSSHLPATPRRWQRGLESDHPVLGPPSGASRWTVEHRGPRAGRDRVQFALPRQRQGITRVDPMFARFYWHIPDFFLSQSSSILSRPISE